MCYTLGYRNDSEDWQMGELGSSDCSTKESKKSYILAFIGNSKCNIDVVNKCTVK